MAAIAELKGPDCGSATKETDKDAEVENPDYVEEDIIESNHMHYKVYYKVAGEDLIKKYGLIKFYSKK